jgi:radical SAM protein with 4Fe4S-binding SPASM domain
MSRRIRIYSDKIPYEFTNLSLRKILNACKVELSLFFHPSRPWGWPVHLMVEPTTFCNLQCALCPVTAGLDRPQGHMELSLFQSVIDEVGEYIFTLLLWDWGEPFLNPEIFRMIAYAKKKGIKVISSTNGHLFTQAEQADAVIHSGLDTLIFAMDGVTQETYQRYRQGGSLESILRGIRTVVSRKRALGSSVPFVNLRFIVMRHNEHEIPRLKQLAQELGVDALTLKTLNPGSQNPYDGAEAENHDDFVPQNQKYRRFKSIGKNGHRVRLKRNPCKLLWNNPTIHWNGNVSPCTYDPKEKYALGNLANHSFQEIWWGDAYQKMRHQFKSHWENIPVCGDCSYAYQGGNCSQETIAEAIFFDSLPSLQSR